MIMFDFIKYEELNNVKFIELIAKRFYFHVPKIVQLANYKDGSLLIVKDESRIDHYYFTIQTIHDEFRFEITYSTVDYDIDERSETNDYKLFKNLVLYSIYPPLHCYCIDKDYKIRYKYIENPRFGLYDRIGKITFDNLFSIVNKNTIVTDFQHPINSVACILLNERNDILAKSMLLNNKKIKNIIKKKKLKEAKLCKSKRGKYYDKPSIYLRNYLYSICFNKPLTGRLIGALSNCSIYNLEQFRTRKIDLKKCRNVGPATLALYDLAFEQINRI